MECKNNFKISDIVKIFLPLLLAVLLQYAVTIGDIIFIFIKNMLSDEKSINSRSIETIISMDYKQPMNLAAVNAIKFILYGIIFGIWYYKAFIKGGAKDIPLIDNIKSCITIVTAVFLTLAGISAQFLIDGVLNICRNIFVDAFKEYDQLVNNVTGASSSWLMLTAVFLLAPIAEELLFRGLILQYSRKLLILPFSIIFQAFLFGVYHGNIIQGIYAFVIGAVLGYLAYKFDSLIPCIITHMAINISLIFVPAALFGSTFACIITTIISLILFVIFISLAIKKQVQKP